MLAFGDDDPAGHLKQTDAPDIDANEPVAQSRQPVEACSGAYCPGLHLLQYETENPDGLAGFLVPAVPASHAEHVSPSADVSKSAKSIDTT